MRLICEGRAERFICTGQTSGDSFAPGKPEKIHLRRANRISFSTDVVYRYHRHKHSMTVSQALDSVAHPIKNLKTKKKLYDGMKELYQYRNVYDRYRGTLWLYMLRVTVNQ